MATVINNPGNSTPSEGNGSGLIMGLIFAILVILALFYFGIPYLRGAMSSPGNSGSSPTTIENNVQEVPNNPETQEGTEINVPDRIDVNVNEGQSPQP